MNDGEYAALLTDAAEYLERYQKYREDETSDDDDEAEMRVDAAAIIAGFLEWAES